MRRKFKATVRQYLKVTLEEGHKESNVQFLLNKRRDVLFEICTRFYEEERKKAEDEIIEVKNLLQFQDKFYILFLLGRRDSFKCKYQASCYVISQLIGIIV